MISAELNNYRLQGVIDFLSLGTGNATVELMDGTQPAFGGTATNVLATIEFVEPIGTISAGTLTITPTLEYLVTLTGIATWARVKNGQGTLAWDCAVSDLLGTAPLKLPDTQLYAGGMTRISSGTLV